MEKIARSVNKNDPMSGQFSLDKTVDLLQPGFNYPKIVSSLDLLPLSIRAKQTDL